jgi:hypothetical protein
MQERQVLDYARDNQVKNCIRNTKINTVSQTTAWCVLKEQYREQIMKLYIVGSHILSNKSYKREDIQK